ncbi:hypothetical protein [Rhizobium ruizarguesonis]|uniref:hypothetical protein n=1 Tax=Rhizobium ruizarguesonis TaxID=2081791 RepID=UPI0014477889|nr:hypothetical protein [Rhizobium ruizarguesonis]
MSDAIRQVRYGAGWLDFSYTPPIKMTRNGEIQQALRLLGYSGYWRLLPDRPTLAAYLDARTGAERDHPCVVFLSTHCVAVSGHVFCDVFSRGVVIDIDDANGRRKRVNRVFVLTKRIAPSPIATRQPVPNAAKAGANSKVDGFFVWRSRLRREHSASRSPRMRSSSSILVKAAGIGWEAGRASRT